METVVAGETGLFFDHKTIESLLDGLDRFEAWLPRFDPLAAVTRAQAFGPNRFRRAFTAVLDEAIADRF